MTWYLHRYEILRTCINELARAGIITDANLSILTYREAAHLANASAAAMAAGSPLPALGAAEPACQQQQQQQQPDGELAGACRMDVSENNAPAVQQPPLQHLSR